MEPNQASKHSELVTKLREHVDTFSAEIPLKRKNNDEVIVGGKIISAINFNIITGPEDVVEDTTDAGVYLKIDDGLGVMNFITFHKIYLELLAQTDNNLIGKTMVGKGKNVAFDKSTDFVTVGGKKINMPTHPNPEELPYIYGYDITLI